MKTVVTSHNVAHLWAHKAQASARNANKSFYFEGDTIYSYGEHFPIARHVKNKRGQVAILFNKREHSVTTTSHKSSVRRAIPPAIPIFFVSQPKAAPSSYDCKELEAKSIQTFAKSKKARTNKAYLMSAALNYIEQAKSLAEFFGFAYKPKNESELASLAEDLERVKLAEKENERLKEIQKEKDNRKNILLWKAGHNVRFFYMVQSYARIEGEELVTSKGARVPLDHVKRAFPMVKRLIEEGRAFKTNGHKIPLGHYQIDEITTDGTLIAGCHTFLKEEVLRIGELINL